MRRSGKVIMILIVSLSLTACHASTTAVEQEAKVSQSPVMMEPSITPIEMNDKDKYELTHINETEHFSIHYSDIDFDSIDTVADTLESNYERISGNLDQQISGKMTVEIYADLEDLHQAMGFPNASDWVRGGYGYGKIIIASPLYPPPGSGFNNVVNAAVHEFVHLMVNQINPDTPRWLNEGIACYEAKDNDESWIKSTVINGIKNNTVPDISDLDTGSDYQAFFDLDGYQYTYTIAEFMVNEFGYQKIINFINTPKDYKEVFDLSEEEFQAKWLEYIKENYKS